MAIVEVYTEITPVREHGMEMFRVRIVTATGRVLFQSIRWSEGQARTDAARWIQRNQYAGKI